MELRRLIPDFTAPQPDNHVPNIGNKPGQLPEELRVHHQFVFILHTIRGYV